MRSRLALHAFICIGAWLVLTLLNNAVEPLMSYYLALVAMYATAMFGMVILVGLSGQVSLGNGAIMAVGAYVFALSYQHWNAVISMVIAGFA
ncbi:MAG: branched-chain amino acid ABC transporter permease, partial [Actinobacteria bacterium]|nr:branched-chain amino acid ABC transporter permease [Actinomycetota bacterium]